MTTEQIGSRFSMLGAQDSGYDPYAIYDETRTEVLSGEFDARKADIGQLPFTTVNYPNVSVVNNSGFYDQKSLQSISCENCLSIGGTAFHGCHSLTAVYAPNVLSVGIQAFRDCSVLTAIDFPNAACSLGAYIASKCYSLLSVNLPNVSSAIGSQLFLSAYSLTAINLSNCLCVTGASAFNSCSSLSTLCLPAAQQIRSSGIFQNCTSLRWLNAPQAKLTLSSNTFAGCYHMQHLVISSLSAGNATALSDLGLSNELSTDADGNSYTCIVETQGQSRANHKVGTTGTKFPYGAPTTTKFVCSNGYIVYKNGVWTGVSS